MSRYTYTGDAPVLFSQYLDVTNPDEPKTLTAVPGETYEIKQADGYDAIQPDGQFEPQELPLPPNSDWTEAEKPAAKKKPAAAEPAAAEKENG